MSDDTRKNALAFAQNQGVGPAVKFVIERQTETLMQNAFCNLTGCEVWQEAVEKYPEYASNEGFSSSKVGI